MMKDLEQCRREIDEIDCELMQLFEHRMHIVHDVVCYKKEHGLAIFQSKREEEVLDKNLNYLEDNQLKKYAEEFLIHLMNISKDYQEDILKDDHL